MEDEVGVEEEEDEFNSKDEEEVNDFSGEEEDDVLFPI